MDAVGKYIEDLYTIFTRVNSGLEDEIPFLCPNTLKSIQDDLNAMFPDSECLEVLYTDNDNGFFGIYVDPVIDPNETLIILFNSNTDQKIRRYKVEIDSKVFDVGLEADEITAILLHDVSVLVENEEIIYDIRACLDQYVVKKASTISAKFISENMALITFALKDTIHKLTSCFYGENDWAGDFIEDNELSNSLRNGMAKILSSVFGINDTVREPKLIILQWALSIYDDIELNARSAIYTLEEAKYITGSRLVLQMIDNVIRALKRPPSQMMTEGVALLEGKRGLFDGLKQSGLRAIEDDLYEFRVRAKNSETEDDAMYTLRQINTRLNIIEEYLYTNENSLRPDEVARWRDLAARYRELREDISRKQITYKKQYGIWMDYDKI